MNAERSRAARQKSGKQRHVKRPTGCLERGSTCRIVGVFSLVVIVVVPAAVFTLSSLFTTLLWGIECLEYRAERDEASSGFEDHTDIICNWYQWFKYVVGNLVGVDLSDIGDYLSGHIFAEMLDLLVSIWSLAVTGSVVALVGGLSMMSLVIEKMDAAPALDEEAIADITAAADDGLEKNEFLDLIASKNLGLSAQIQERIFSACDNDGSGARVSGAL